MTCAIMVEISMYFMRNRHVIDSRGIPNLDNIIFLWIILLRQTVLGGLMIHALILLAVTHFLRMISEAPLVKSRLVPLGSLMTVLMHLRLELNV